MQVSLGGRAAEADEILADGPRRNARQLDTFTLDPSHESLNRRHGCFLRMRIVVLGMEEFIPGDAGRPRAGSTSDGRAADLARA